MRPFVTMTVSRPLPSAALAALLLAAPLGALAQSKARSATPRPSATLPALTPAPGPAAPAPSIALEPPTAIAEERPWRVAGTLGYENDSDADVKGPRLEAQLERDLVPLGDRGQLSFVAVAGWSLGLNSKSVSVGPISVTTDVTRNLFELVPGFRAAVTLQPRLRLFAEMGVGGGWAATSVEVKSSFAATERFSTSDGFGVLRLGAGATFQLNPRVRLGLALPTFTWRYGAATEQSFSFSAMAAYAL